LSTPKPEF